MSDIIQQNYEDINSFEKAAIKRAKLGMKENIEQLEEYLFKNMPDYLKVTRLKKEQFQQKQGISFLREDYTLIMKPMNMYFYQIKH